MAPTVVGVGTVASGVGTITPGLPTGTAAGHVLVLVAETGNEPLPAMSGWQNIGSGIAQQATGTNITALTLRWKAAAADEVAPTVPDSGDHQVARILGISGADTLNPFSGTPAFGVDNTTGTAATIPGTTTTDADTLVIAALSTGQDVASTTMVSGWTNANLTSITERMDNWVTAGNGGGFGVITGVKATAGAIGNTTATLTTANTKAVACLAIKAAITITGKTASDTATLTESISINVIQPISTSDSATITESASVTILEVGQAARFNATGEQFTNTISLGTQSSYTIAFWGKLSVDRNTYSSFLEIAYTSSAGLHIQADVDGQTLILWDDNTMGILATGPLLVVGRWYFIAVTVNGTSATLYTKDELGTVFTVNYTGASRNLNSIFVGSNHIDEWLNGCVAAVKLWTGVGLTQTELATEATQYDAVRTANLARAWRLNGDGAEQSGNGTALTGGVGVSWETGPPIPLGASGPTTKSTSDTATLAESISIVRSSDLADSITVSDTSALTVGYSLTDISNLTDLSTLSIIESKTATDSSVLTESIARLESRTITDSSTLADTTPAVVVTSSATDTQTYTESIAIVATIATTESTAVSAETASVLAANFISVSDTVATTETVQSITATVAATESIPTTEAIAASITSTHADASTFTDSIVVQAGNFINVSDTDTASETIQIAVNHARTESEVATDVIAVQRQSALTDSTTFTEVANVTRTQQVAASDTTTVNESIAVAATLPVSDQSSLTEQISVGGSAFKTASDSFSFTESALIVVTIVTQETHSTSETSATLAQTNVSDLQVQSENVSLQALLTVLETHSTVDESLLTITEYRAVSDSIAFSEDIILDQIIGGPWPIEIGPPLVTTQGVAVTVVGVTAQMSVSPTVTPPFMVVSPEEEE